MISDLKYIKAEPSNANFGAKYSIMEYLAFQEEYSDKMQQPATCV